MGSDVDCPIPLNHFSGGANISEGAGSLAELLNNLDARSGLLHIPIVSPTQADGPPGTVPDIGAFGPLSYLIMDGVAGVKKVYRTIKIPGAFIDSPVLHVHWTKSDDVDRSDETVRWRAFYSIFDGDGGIVPAETMIEFDDTYLDGSGASRAIHRTIEVPLVGFIPEYYVGVRVERGTPPSGTPMDAPAIVTVDLTMNVYVNRSSVPIL